MIFILFYSIQADNNDFIEWKLDNSTEEVVAIMSSFVLKVEGGIWEANSAYLLVYYNFEPNAGTQSAETIRGL